MAIFDISEKTNAVQITRDGNKSQEQKGVYGIDDSTNSNQIFITRGGKTIFEINTDNDIITVNGGAFVGDSNDLLVAINPFFFKPSGGGGGSVDSVNGETGIVVLDSDDLLEESNITSGSGSISDALTILSQNLFTCVLEGGVVGEAISGTPGLLDISAGNGRVVVFTNANIPVVTPVSWSEMLDVSIPDILTDNFSSVYFDVLGNLQIVGGLVTTPSLRRNNITLMVVLHEDNVNITGKTDNSVPGYNGIHALVDYAAAQGGTLSGSDITTPNANLSFKQESGTITIPFTSRTIKNDPTIRFNTGSDPVQFTYSYRDGVGGFTDTALTSNIDPTQYDDGSGTLQPVGNPNPDWTWQPVFYFGQINRVVIAYGQVRYDDKDEAINGISEDIEEFIFNPLFASAKIIGFFVVDESATDLTDTNLGEYVKVTSSSIGGGAGATNLNSLSDVVITTPSQGDILYFNGASWVNLGSGNEGEFLSTHGSSANPTWVIPANLQKEYDWDAGTSSGDPGSGKIRGDNATLGNITNLYSSQTAKNGDDNGYILSSLVSGNKIFIKHTQDASDNIEFILDATPVDNGSWYTISGTVSSSSGSLANQQNLIITYFFPG